MDDCRWANNHWFNAHCVFHLATLPKWSNGNRWTFFPFYLQNIFHFIFLFSIQLKQIQVHTCHLWLLSTRSLMHILKVQLTDFIWLHTSKATTLQFTIVQHTTHSVFLLNWLGVYLVVKFPDSITISLSLSLSLWVTFCVKKFSDDFGRSF